MHRPTAAFLALVLPCLSVPAVGMDASAYPPSVHGSVLVNQDGQYVPLNPGAPLAPGSRVMALDGPATLTYADGCVTPLESGSMTTVGPASPCAGGDANLIRASDTTLVGSSGSTDRVADDTSGGGSGPGGFSPDWLVGAGLGAAIIAIAVTASNSGNNGTSVGGSGGGVPVSP